MNDISENAKITGTELSRLITRLERGIAKGASYVKTIRHPQLLVHSLKELQELIGNDKVKESVAQQITHLIMVKRRAMENSSIKEDEVMLNTVLYGDPGVGKTLIGAKLAKIWYSLGYLDGSHNTSEKRQGLADTLKDILKDNGGLSGGNDDTMITYYVMFIFIMVFLTIITLAWSFYTKFGGYWTIFIISIMVIFIVVVGFYVSASMNNDKSFNSNKAANNNAKNTKGINDFPSVANDTVRVPINSSFIMPTDDQVIKVVTRADFIDRYVGWTDKKTIKLMQDNLGKVLFVDEAYSLVTDMHDSFGIEALTTINLFLSQHPKEIIVIFAGYKDLMETGIFSVQPGLKRRFMWQLDCDGYTYEQLYQIFAMQLKKKGWGLTDEKATVELFRRNEDAFPAYGGDTERLTFYAKCQHSSQYIQDETGMSLTALTPAHVKRGIEILRENNIQSDNGAESSNPLANMMKMFRGNKQNAKVIPKKQRPVVEEITEESKININSFNNSSMTQSKQSDLVNDIKLGHGPDKVYEKQLPKYNDTDVLHEVGRSFTDLDQDLIDAVRGTANDRAYH